MAQLKRSKSRQASAELEARCAAAEARADVAERRLQSVLDALPEGVVLLDEAGRYLAWNARYAAIYHRSADLFRPGAFLMDTLRVGVGRGDYPDAVGREEAWLAEREAQILGGASRFEQRLSDGCHLLVEDRRTRDGEIVGLRIDVTEMKRQAAALAEALEGAEAANAAKSAFLAMMSHEIRTPLNGVLGMARAMAADALSPVQRERLSVVHDCGEALLAILNDILDLSKVEAGKLELECIEFDLAAVAQGAYSAFTALANKKGLSFSLEIAGARGRYVGDPTRVRQVLYNLISNAVKFTEAGGIRVTGGYAGGVLELAVADTGPGIPEAARGRLFDRFDQLDSAMTRRFGGAGLGLAICRDLATAMGGAIEVESEVGRGSRFVVRLPLTRIGGEQAEPSLPGPQASPPAPLPLRVLAAEDNAVNQLVLKTLLHQLGVEPTVVGDGRAAVEAWRGGGWDVILMDIQMPLMDGLEATEQIRAAEQAGDRPRTPIIALTANAMPHQVAAHLSAGMDGHVSKPIAVTDLVSALEAVLASRGDGSWTDAAAAGGGRGVASPGGVE
ncbi:ATP-binding protein [Phenylobacterium sp. VNQ135]|uniref:ATP-binding protein n=1 Tax=Phenylobacterium sp. VNQ135 TaxID=3400922 RepID=UPI003C019840